MKTVATVSLGALLLALGVGIGVAMPRADCTAKADAVVTQSKAVNAATARSMEAVIKFDVAEMSRATLELEKMQPETNRVFAEYEACK